jgi:2,5-diamino-6-(ribosylamino)-4(3H)-pyrimidinone 5'-phosphate reductase
MVTRPYVILNVAASVDGKIDTFERRGAAISSERDRARVDALRASVDAVMIGGHTVVDEDPRLTVKSAELRAERLARGVPENPAKVAVISSLDRLNPGGRFVTSGRARVIVFASDTVGATRHQGKTDSGTTIRHERGEGSDTFATLRERGVEVFPVGAGRVDLAAAMRTLRDMGMARVLVEGGGTLNFELLRLGLVDEVHMFVAPVIFGGATAPTLADGQGFAREVAISLTQVEVDVWDDGGVLLRYKVKPA